MFQYNPTVNNISGQIYGQGIERAAGYTADAIQTKSEMQLLQSQRQHDLIVDTAKKATEAIEQAVGMMVGVPIPSKNSSNGSGGGDSGMLSSILESYSNRKMVEAKASSYDDIGKILAGGMFSNNPEAAQAFSNIAKQKDPYKKTLAYEQIFDLLGPLSNAQMAQNDFGYSSELANQQAAARNQVPANQQPMAPLGTNASANNAVPASPYINPDIKTRPRY